jgi:hypothetical protein
MLRRAAIFTPLRLAPCPPPPSDAESPQGRASQSLRRRAGGLTFRRGKRGTCMSRRAATPDGNWHQRRCSRRPWRRRQRQPSTCFHAPPRGTGREPVGNSAGAFHLAAMHRDKCTQPLKAKALPKCRTHAGRLTATKECPDLRARAAYTS